MTTSKTNTVLNQLRETADVLGKSQSTVAANWMRGGLTTKPYNPRKHTGITRTDYKRAQGIVARLARSAS